MLSHEEKLEFLAKELARNRQVLKCTKARPFSLCWKIHDALLRARQASLQRDWERVEYYHTRAERMMDDFVAQVTRMRPGKRLQLARQIATDLLLYYAKFRQQWDSQQTRQHAT